MNKYWQYIKYLWKAQNAHGLHSPFVFALYQQAICKKDTTILAFPLRKYEQLLFKVLNYMQMKHIVYIGSDFLDFSEKFSLFFYIFEQKSFTHSILDHSLSQPDAVLYLDRFNLNTEEILNLLGRYKTIVIPHLTENRRLFDCFCNHPNFAVTIDCYEMGFIFQRPQNKAHFILRY